MGYCKLLEHGMIGVGQGLSKTTEKQILTRTANCRIWLLMATTQTKSRLEARVEPQIYELLKRAAEIEGRTLTDFVVAAASSAARETIESIEVLQLSKLQQEFIAEMNASPSAVAPAMKRATERHKILSSLHEQSAIRR